MGGVGPTRPAPVVLAGGHRVALADALERRRVEPEAGGATLAPTEGHLRQGGVRVADGDIAGAEA